MARTHGENARARMVPSPYCRCRAGRAELVATAPYARPRRRGGAPRTSPKRSPGTKRYPRFDATLVANCRSPRLIAFQERLALESRRFRLAALNRGGASTHDAGESHPCADPSRAVPRPPRLPKRRWLVLTPPFSSRAAGARHGNHRNNRPSREDHHDTSYTQEARRHHRGRGLATATFARSRAFAQGTPIRVGLLSLTLACPLRTSRPPRAISPIRGSMSNFSSPSPGGAANGPWRSASDGTFDFRRGPPISGGLIRPCRAWRGLKVIGGALQESTNVEGQKILVSESRPTNPAWTTPADFVAKRYGITTAGSSYHYMGPQDSTTVKGFAPRFAGTGGAAQRGFRPVIALAAFVARSTPGRSCPTLPARWYEAVDVFEIGEISD